MLDVVIQQMIGLRPEMTVDLKSLDLNLLVIFEAVYSTENISRAADRLEMSQPAVSNALARLRDVLDDPLFVRATGGVEPVGRNPLPDEDAAPGSHRDGVARAGLQSDARHEYHGNRTTHGGDED